MNKNWMSALREKKSLTATMVFCIVALAMVLVGVFALQTPVVAMCVMVILEAGIAAMLHKAELWVHGVLILAEIIAGVIAGRIVLVILCAVIYAAATVALQILGRDE